MFGVTLGHIFRLQNVHYEFSFRLKNSSKHFFTILVAQSVVKVTKKLKKFLFFLFVLALGRFFWRQPIVQNRKFTTFVFAMVLL
jgi:hypothetical protein